MLQYLSGLRDSAGEHEGESAESLDILLDGSQPGIDRLGDVFEFGSRIGVPDPTVELDEKARQLLVMLVLDLADDLLDDVFDRQQAFGAAEFVDNDGEVDALSPHSGEQIEHTHRFRNVKRRPDQIPNFLRRVGGRLLDHENVLDVNHADDGVEAVFVDRKPAVTRLGKGGDETLERHGDRYGDDVGARDGDVPRGLFAEVEDVPEHLALDVREIADPGDFSLAIFDRLLDLVAKGRLAILAEQEGSQPSPERTSIRARTITVVIHLGSAPL